MGFGGLKMVVFRVDGNKHIGAGHLMRCLTIASEICTINIENTKNTKNAENTENTEKNGNTKNTENTINTLDAMNNSSNINREKENYFPDPSKEILFVCADEQSATLPREKGFQVAILNSDFSKMEEEISTFIAVLKKIVEEQPVNKVTILVDSYYVTANYLKSLRDYGKVFLLDDMCQERFDVDGIINYNAFADRKKYQLLYPDDVEQQPQFYLGAAFVPIRREFRNCISEVQNEAIDEAIDNLITNFGSIEDIMITTGGADEDNIAGKIVQKIYKSGFRYHIISGKYNPHFQALTKWAEEHSGVFVYHDVTDMAAKMKTCQLAITAGGTTIYELSALGVPFICFSYAKNQELLTEYIGENKIAGYAGAYHVMPKETLDNIKRMVEMLVDDTKLAHQYQIQENKLVDGLGARRLAKLLTIS